MLARFKPQRKKWFHKDSGHLLRWSIFLHVTGVDFIVGCRDSAPVDQFGTRNRSYRSIVRSVAFLVQRCLTVNQHNTVVQGKYIAATSWLCVLLDNTTVDNVFIHLDIKLTCIEAKSDWLNENDELRMKRLFFSWKRLLCFPVPHWLKFNDSVLNSACDWLALIPLQHSDN